MKKILLTIAMFIGVITSAFSKEIIPEYYVMERLLIPIEDSKTYKYIGAEEIGRFKEIKAIQVDKKVLKGLGTSENPFYMKSSSGNVKAVRVGDYIVSPLNLSSVYFVAKDTFEQNYRDINALEVSIETAEVSTMTEKVDTSEVDEANNRINTSEN
ncbi:MAG: hypothetical protein Q4B33_02325 [Fusobacterium sp.]|nr:hypothetical protein [Fusobacterium sp.]